MLHFVIFCNYENYNNFINTVISKDLYYKTLITKDKSMIDICKHLYHKIYYVEEDFNRKNNQDTPELDHLLDKIHAEKNIDGIYSVSEYMIEKLAGYRDKYNIKYGLRSKDALYFRNKIKMKEILKENNKINIPNNKKLESFEDVIAFMDEHKKKAVIKPVDGAGSQDVYIVEFSNFREILKDFKGDYTEYEIEEFIEGSMFHLDSIIFNGEVKFISIGEYGKNTLSCRDSSPNYGFIHADFTNPLYKSLKTFNEEVISSLPIREGVTHMEAISSKCGIYFIEIAARIAGAGIDFAIHDATGVNLIVEGAAANFGIEPLQNTVVNHLAGGYVIPYKKNGKIIEITDSKEFYEIPEVKTAIILNKVGDDISFDGTSGEVEGIVTWISNSENRELNTSIADKIMKIWRIKTDVE